MQAAVLLWMLSAGQLTEETLLASLDTAVERLLEEDPQVAEVRKAVRLLAETNSGDRWTNYSAATRILRKTRSKAGIPLLLAYMVRHVEFSTSHVVVPEYVETLTILTGKEIPNPYQYVADRKTPVLRAVEKLFTEWWEPNQRKIDTDVNHWSGEQLAVLGERVLKRSAGTFGGFTDPEGWKEGPTAYAIAHLLDGRLLGRSSDAPTWQPDELHPRMLPVLLASAGYRVQADEPPARDTSRPAYAAVPLLAALRQDGELTELDKLAEDARQTAGTRLTCVLALYRAGEKLRTPALLSIATADKNLERRLVAILTLRYSDERRVGDALVALLDADNAEIRTAAIYALRGPLPAPAVPKLKRVIEELDPPQALSAAFRVLGEYKSRAAGEALVAFLAASLEDRRKAEHLSHALAALETATGQRWLPAGPQTPEFYRAQAKEAMLWWQAGGRLVVE